jgi:3-methyladenine DNA glycosylase Tag
VVVQSKTQRQLRLFARRVIALIAAKRFAVVWRPIIGIRCLEPASIGSRLRQLASWQNMNLGGAVAVRRVKPGSKAAVRVAARFLKLITSYNSSLLGKDEVGARLRRYVANQGLPDNDRIAFSRFCDLILSRGVGLAAIEREREVINTAFAGFEPGTVATLDVGEIARHFKTAALRDRRKILACIAAAKSWCLASAGGYMARTARIAAEDDALLGWPKLIAMIRQDFGGVGNTMAAALLKRWGFFTASAQLGAQRILSRLGLVDSTADAKTVQAFLVRVSDTSSLTPNGVEGTLAIFAGSGPCREQPRCEECPLSGRCPSSSIADVVEESGFANP